MAENDDLAAQLKTLEAEVEKWKTLSRKNEERAKENAAASDELKKLKEASLSDQQKREASEKEHADKLAELERRANESDARALRAEVASAKKLTAAQAKRLQGTTREELEADADDLLETFKPSNEGESESESNRKSAPVSRPREQLRGGGAPAEEVVELNPAKLAEAVPRQ